MHAVVWSDYLCPWCYLGRDRTRLMERLGVEVTPRPYELHPRIPSEGLSIRPDGHLQRVFDHIEAECDRLGIPFARPARVPNTGRALEAAELARIHFADEFERLDEALFASHWVDGGDLGDRDHLDALLDGAGVSPDEIAALIDDGAGSAAVEASMREAHRHDVTSTPFWLFDDSVLLPGVQSHQTVEHWIARLRDRAARGA